MPYWCQSNGSQNVLQILIYMSLSETTAAVLLLIFHFKLNFDGIIGAVLFFFF